MTRTRQEAPPPDPLDVQVAKAHREILHLTEQIENQETVERVAFSVLSQAQKALKEAQEKFEVEKDRLAFVREEKGEMEARLKGLLDALAQEKGV